ncbi:Rne/Rng family ribonuclease [Amorphus coralli]|uniref:Rne/Rng family ribonuclease n=1 Tax=Amorphus coralli TaxID=340680 RepID=UPI00037D0B0A|nr:ribonuclease E/G [Amorphus coralli]
MANKMLVDAAHPEETRVVVVRGNRVEDFDFEAAARKPLRGNIYLAKVTRVEPSLQAAFVDYGGNRHGFLAFNEIHPDYYQIPHADRAALLAEEAEEAKAQSGSDDADKADKPKRSRRSKASDDADASVQSSDSEDDADTRAKASDGEDGENGDGGDEDSVESVGAEDAMDEVMDRRSSRPARKTYKIQEVIKRRQILLVQVVKEERGNKGAALTTYLSLAGRYSVLMPNTARGGGISRKITSPQDRKRLKEIAGELEVPEGMGVILRTAGASRTKAEIRRDFEYLLRLWETVRDLTLKSVAPTLVYEEGSLIKRSIRDLYNKDIDEILVCGEPAYKEAKDFMRMLMPSHAKNVKPYRDITPIFTRFGVEAQLDAMFSPQVTLPSGGYIVLNPTEALVSIDVNSGRATREHNIEATALQTNLEASEEIARQLRLRDLAGLVVIDFIDMEEKRNNRSVERKLKDCLKVDRARIQVGRISHFGLMEMSRQRIRQGVVESSTTLCTHCHGTGIVRSTDSVALYVLRCLEDHLLRSANHHLNVRTPVEVALYILNQKRAHLAELEVRFGLTISVTADDTLGTKHLEIDNREPVVRPEGEEPPQAVIEVHEEEPEEPQAETASEDGDKEPRRRRRRRRGRRGGQDVEQAGGRDEARQQDASADSDETSTDEGDGDTEAEVAQSGEDDENRPRRRRGRRGGRRNRRNRDEAGEENGETRADGASGDDAERAGSDDAGEAAGSEVAETASDVTETGDKPHEPPLSSEPPHAPEAASDADGPAKTETPVVAEAAQEPIADEMAAAGTDEAILTAANDAGAPVDSDVETVVAAEEIVEAEPEPAQKDEPVEAEKDERAARLHSIHGTPQTSTEAADQGAAEADEEGSKSRSKRGWWQRRSFF